MSSKVVPVVAIGVSAGLAALLLLRHHFQAKAKAKAVLRTPIDRRRIYAIIPARSGSKGVKGKNIRNFCGKPLMAWAIDNGLRSKYIKRVFVSTDSEEYQKVAKEHGAEVPFLRPKEISHDTATDYQLIDHFIRWMQENEPDQQPSLIVQLRPTAPCRTAESVDQAIDTFLASEEHGFDSLRSVTPADHEAFNQYFVDPREAGHLVPVIPVSHVKDNPNEIITEPQSVARQILPKIYWHNAYVDIIRPSTIIEQKCCMGRRCLAFHMTAADNVDIDTEEQWAAAEARKKAQLAGP
uniref:N-acylneuraminate cytidylyltransferase n=1 Tax=Noctiluca scintillans TaxID=2966 RepID=A0A7S1FC59_NOCSC|mmetsp:Transcript_5238/g.14836  ORF Transcript_5238/g.14836 Transcript_5238/m.14836 type:complete len:295 (+) Transcript_5238:66-950(+)